MGKLSRMAYASFRAIVPAGGAGSRLWPTSRRSNPKFLHDFTGEGQSLLQTTVDRLNAAADEVLVVTGDVHASAVQDQVPACAVLTEPSPKDSMPAIALGAAVLQRRYPREDLVVGSFAADHVITNTENFAGALESAVAQAREGEVVTIGITPTHGSTAYGYIRPGEELTSAALRVEAFVEKPDAGNAADYVESGYLWNAGMYVARASVLLEALERYRPELAAGVAAVAEAWDTPQRREVLEEVWPTLEAISIDHAIAEPLAEAGGVAVVPADLGWSDVGDWDAIATIHSGGDADAVTVLGEADRALVLDSPGAVIAPHQKQVVVVGIEGAVVIETGDAILVTTRERAQEVKDAVEQLAHRRTDLL